MPAASCDRVWPRWTRPSSPPGATEAAGVGRGRAGACATGGAAVAGSAAGAGSAGATTGCGARTMLSDGRARGAWITGASMGAVVRGASTRAEYSRTSRPWPQSTSTRKASAATSTGTLPVTRTTARSWASVVISNCRSRTSPVGGCRPTLAKVSDEASRARAFSSSPGSLEMIGISARNGSPGADSTRIWPNPSAIAPPLASSNAISSSQCHGRLAPLPRMVMRRTIADPPPL